MEIKRAFRRLAVVFHPDKNPSKEAATLFQEINEAHEVLSDPEQRTRYDQLLGDGRVATPAQPWHRDPAYRRRYQPGYKPRPAGPSERLLMMAHFLKYLRLICFVGIGWCALLTIDYFLPPRISLERVLPEGHRVNSWQFHHVPNVVVTEKSHQFAVAKEGLDFFPVGSVAKVISSRVLHIILEVKSEGEQYAISSVDSVFSNFLFVPMILLGSSLFGLTLRKGIEFRFSFEVTLCMLLFFNLIFLLFSIL